MVDKAIVNTVQRYLTLLAERGLKPHFCVIFGSYATGEPHRWSDIDVMVVSPHFDGKHNRRDRDLLWTSVIPIDSRIEPVPCGLKQWEDDDGTPLVEIVRREGVMVWR